MASTVRNNSLNRFAALRQTVSQPKRLFWGCLLIILSAEILIATGYIQLGAGLHTTLLALLVVGGAFSGAAAVRALALSLVLAPLIRILSLSLPLALFPQLVWYPIMAAPLLYAAWIVIRQLRLQRRDLGLRSGNLALQLMVAGIGPGIGMLEYHLLAPEPLLPAFTWNDALIWGLIIIVATGFTEELIFRGLLQTTAWSVMRHQGLVYVSLLFAILHIGHLSLPNLIVVFAIGLLFAYIVHRGGSLLGVALAHGIANVMLFLIIR